MSLSLAESRGSRRHRLFRQIRLEQALSGRTSSGGWPAAETINEYDYECVKLLMAYVIGEERETERGRM